jgi:sialidase-1
MATIPRSTSLLWLALGTTALLVLKMLSRASGRTASLLSHITAGGAKSLSSTTVFAAGSDNYHTYRIPSLLAVPTASGTTLLAFAEARSSVRDWGEIDLVMKTSKDGGTSWSQLQVIVTAADVGLDRGATVGNPCPVYDEVRKRIVMLITTNTAEDNEAKIWAARSKRSREVFALTSDDHGQSWSKPRNITPSAKPVKEWTWYATGPGVGIQLRHQNDKTLNGRLVIPCDHVATYVEGGDARYSLHSHVVVSDDGGENWRLGGVAAPFTNECQVL